MQKIIKINEPLNIVINKLNNVVKEDNLTVKDCYDNKYFFLGKKIQNNKFNWHTIKTRSGLFKITGEIIDKGNEIEIILKTKKIIPSVLIYMFIIFFILFGFLTNHIIFCIFGFFYIPLYIYNEYSFLKITKNSILEILRKAPS